MLDELVLSQQDQPQTCHSVHQIANVGVNQVIFSWRFWFEMFVEMSAKELTHANSYTRYNCLKLLLLTLLPFGLVIKCCLHELH